MCLSIANARPSDVLARGIHAGHEWMAIHNGMGYRCGYVKVQPGHPWHGVAAEEIDVDVHGGLTFSEHDQPCANPDGKDDGYWVGFDCAHYMDAQDPSLPPSRDGVQLGHRDGVVRTQEYVESECRNLCEQAEAEGKKKESNATTH